MFKTIVGLPAYNEEGSLSEVFRKIINVKNNYLNNLEVIVVNDGSTDSTEEILKEYASQYSYIKYINHEKNEGLGCAIKTLFEYAIENYDNEDILVTMDADNTHNPIIIPKLCNKVKREQLDVVIASRFVKGGEEKGLSLTRKIYSRGARLFFKIFFPIKDVSDYSSGFRAYNIGYLKKVMEIYKGKLITTDGFDCMAEILARFSKIGVKAGEYPLVLEYNLKRGNSKMNVLKTIKGYFDLIKKVKDPY